MLATTTFPRSQHWTVNKFRVSVLVYKRSTDSCATCGTRPAIHAVWADGRGTLEGFSGGPAHFCDQHRPAKGTLPPLDYKKLVQGMDLLGKPTGAVIYEHLDPRPERTCRECGGPAPFEISEQCAGCDDPAQQYTTIRMLPSASGATWVDDDAQLHHRPHDTRQWWACGKHAPAPSTPMEQS